MHENKKEIKNKKQTKTHPKIDQIEARSSFCKRNEKEKITRNKRNREKSGHIKHQQQTDKKKNREYTGRKQICGKP